MNLKFWKKAVSRFKTICIICDKDVTNEMKIYWVGKAYCPNCYHRQTCKGFGESLK